MEITGTKQRFEGGAPLLWNLDRRPAFGSDGSERTENRYNGYGADALAGTSNTRINPETGNACSDRMQVHADMEAVTRVLIEHQRGNGLNVTDQLVLTQGRTALLPGETYLPAQGNRQNTPEGAEDPAWVDLVAQYARKADLESMTAEFGMSHMLPWTQTFEANARPEIPANVEKVWLKEPDEEVSGRPSVYGPLTHEQAKEKVASQFKGRRYQLQEHVHGKALSDQYFVDPRDGGVVFLGETEQIIVDGHHTGNAIRALQPGMVIEPFHHMVAGLVLKNMKGFLGVDSMGTRPEEMLENARMFKLLRQFSPKLADGVWAALIKFIGRLPVNLRRKALVRLHALLKLIEWNPRLNGSSITCVVMHRLELPYGHFEREVSVNQKMTLGDAISVVDGFNADLRRSNSNGKLLVNHAGFFKDDHTIGLMAVGDTPDVGLWHAMVSTALRA